MIFKAEKKKSSKSQKDSKGIKYLGGLLLSRMAMGGAAQLRFNADEVNKLNVFPVPDGDTGDNMRMTIESGIAAIEKMDSDDLAEVMRALSHGMLIGARGNSGVILSQFFAGIAKGFDGVGQADPAALGYALQLGVKQAYTSVMTPTEGTILTVAREAVEFAVSRITPASTIRTFFADLVGEMHASVERTPEVLTVLKEAGVVDSGGAGLFYIMDGFNRVLNGEEPDVREDDAKTPEAPHAEGPDLDAFGPDSVMTYGYCTEMLLRLQNAKGDPEAFDLDALKAFLSSVGDSVVAFRTESIVKLHVHTFTPEKVIAHVRTFGEMLTIKIENMSLQHTAASESEKPAEPVAVSSTFAVPTPSAPTESAPESEEKKPYGIVAVCTGEGISNLYRELGTDYIINGGQTNNPSTGDFLKAFDCVPAENIFVFPNNGNIFMAASQAAELYDKATIHVLPSKSIGAGYVAISSVDLSDPNPEAIVEAMTEAIGRVATGYVSPSIRDTEIGGITIHCGDTIGILGKEIVVSTPERADAALALASKMLALPDKFMLTVFRGADATEEEAEALSARISEACPDAEVYFIDGGQDIYPYIFVAE